LSSSALASEEGFTIRRLADKLDIKEYRLRRLINGQLGYRNFNRFLNKKMESDSSEKWPVT
jgi:hypothetical protein